MIADFSWFKKIYSLFRNLQVWLFYDKSISATCLYIVSKGNFSDNTLFIHHIYHKRFLKNYPGTLTLQDEVSQMFP